MPTERVGHQGVGVLPVHPVLHGQAQFADGGLPQRRQFHPRKHHDGFTGCFSRVATPLPYGGRNHQRGEPLESLRPRTGQVAQVIAGRDHQAGQTGRSHTVCSRRQPSGVHLRGEPGRHVSQASVVPYVGTGAPARRSQYVVPVVLRGSVVNHRAGWSAGQRSARLPRQRRHADHPISTRAVGGMSRPGLATAVPGRSHPVLQGTPGGRGR